MTAIINIVVNLALENNKIAICYSRPSLDILLKKWFPLFEDLIPWVTTQGELVSPICSTQLAIQECGNSLKLVIKEQFLQEQRPTQSITTSPLPTCEFHRLKTCIESSTSCEHVTSPPRKKSRIAYRVQIVDSEEDEERTCWKEMGGGDDGKLQATTHANLEEEPEVNID